MLELSEVGNCYHLVNFDKREYVSFQEGAKEREFLHNQPSLIVHYLFENNGDRICFIGDEWTVGSPFEILSMKEIFHSFKNVTEEYEASLKEMLEM
jgi:hypothetical protein